MRSGTARQVLVPAAYALHTGSTFCPLPEIVFRRQCLPNRRSTFFANADAGTGSRTPRQRSQTMADVVELIEHDHREVEQLFADFESSKDAALAIKICDELTKHTFREE